MNVGDVTPAARWPHVLYRATASCGLNQVTYTNRASVSAEPELQRGSSIITPVRMVFLISNRKKKSWYPYRTQLLVVLKKSFEALCLLTDSLICFITVK